VFLLTLLAWVSLILAGCLTHAGDGDPTEVNMQPVTSAQPGEETSILRETSTTPDATSTPEVTATATATSTPLPTPTPLPPPFFDTLVESLTNGNAWQVVGVYVEDLLALRVVQQPASDPAYVSTLPNTATYFAMVTQVTGNTGLLAHNYLAGIYYFDLVPGQVVVLIYGDGRTEEYMVSEMQEYQALNPNSPTSNFVDLASGETLSSTDLFYMVYGGSARTTLQTCIAQGNEPSWGRLFVIAPLE
jgi:hypothetical protein